MVPTNKDLPRWAQTLANLGVAGAVLIYVAYDLIPSLQKQQTDTTVMFHAMMDRQQEEYVRTREEFRQARVDFEAAIRLLTTNTRPR